MRAVPPDPRPLVAAVPAPPSVCILIHMRPARSFVVLAASASLLALQMSGLHMHVNRHGYAGIPVGTHVHSMAGQTHSHGPAAHEHGASYGRHRDSEHDGDRDVSVVELGFGASKVMLFLGWVALGIVGVLKLSRHAPAPAPILLPHNHRNRWRPPLRAPPVFSPT